MSWKAFSCRGESTSPQAAKNSRWCVRNTSATSGGWLVIASGQNGRVGLKDIEGVQQIQRAGGGASSGVGHVEVPRGGRQTGMSHQDLDLSQVGSRFQQMGREGVPQGVRMNRFVDAGPLGCRFASAVDTAAADGLIGLIAREEPNAGLLP